jgi:hypothetical protein
MRSTDGGGLVQHAIYVSRAMQVNQTFVHLQKIVTV